MNKEDDKKLPTNIKKGHEIVFAQQDLTSREADLFALMIAHMTPEHWDNVTIDEPSPSYVFTSSQLKEWLFLKSDNIAAQIDSVAERLSTRKISARVIDEKGELQSKHVPLMRAAEYKNRKLILKPNSDLKKQYIEYKNGFSLIDTKTYLSLKREYSKRIYEMLSRFKDTGKLPIYSLDMLRGFMGLLTEHGKIKKDKISMMSNSTFLTRCIRDSIKDLNDDDVVKKQLIFLKSDDGELGFKTHKKGRAIDKIEFLYHWIDAKQPVEKLLFQDAKNNITRLETKRLTTNESLSYEELELLAFSYRSIGEDELALPIENALIEKIKASEAREIVDEDKSFLAKIEELKKINGDKAY